jgi:hypothetical protein
MTLRCIVRGGCSEIGGPCPSCELVCDDCKGSGNGPSAKTAEGDMMDYPCPTCGGRGAVNGELSSEEKR